MLLAGSRIKSVSEFQAIGPATEKARDGRRKCWAGNAVRQVGDGWRNADAAACQHWRPGCSAPTDNGSARPFRHWTLTFNAPEENENIRHGFHLVLQIELLVNEAAVLFVSSIHYSWRKDVSSSAIWHSVLKVAFWCFVRGCWNMRAADIHVETDRHNRRITPSVLLPGAD